jgi:hypothetical protein
MTDTQEEECLYVVTDRTPPHPDLPRNQVAFAFRFAVLMRRSAQSHLDPE